MANQNLDTLNARIINVSDGGLLVNGQVAELLIPDENNNICITPNSFGLNACYGETFVDGSSSQVMTAVLDISGMVQLAFSPEQRDPNGNLFTLQLV